MTAVRRLKAAGAVVALGAIITCTYVWGDSSRSHDKAKSSSLDLDSRLGADLPESLAVSKFADHPVVRYTALNGDEFVALQVKPELPAVESRPRDYLIAVSTTATQAGMPLAQAKVIASRIAANCSADDRIALWTINVAPKDLTGGFIDPKLTQKAFKNLVEEYGSGATDLIKCLTKTVSAFEDKAGRQQVLVYIGSGASTLDAGQNDDQVKLADEMVKREIAFYPIPLGNRLDPKNLHTLTSLTGGVPIRLQKGQAFDSVVKDLHRALEIPVLYSAKIELPAAIAEHFPAKLPPLRADSATLVLARGQKIHDLAYTIKGSLDGKTISVVRNETLPESESDNFFLTDMVNQWRNDRDMPAMLSASRVLDRSYEQHQFARMELVAQAEEAFNQNNLDAAQKLFKQAELFDPENPEAKTGVKLVEVMKEKKLSRDDLLKDVGPKNDDSLIVIKNSDKGKGESKAQDGEVLSICRKQNENQGAKVTKGNRQELLAMALKQPAKADAGQPVDPLEEVKRRQLAEDQRVKSVVDEAIKKADGILTSNPDVAHDSLKRTLDGVRNNPDLSDKARADLEDRLSKALRYVDTQGVKIKRDQEERLKALSVLNSKNAREQAVADQQERVRERLASFHSLMQQGRALEANKAATLLGEDLINQGIRPPVAVVAAYQTSLISYHEREIKEVLRKSRERFLATMLEVERSHVPFPDEPPVEFPPAATWKALTALRKEKYENSGFTTETPKRMIEMRDTLNKVVKFEGLNDPKATLGEFLETLSERYDLTFEVNEQAFKTDTSVPQGDAMSVAIAEKPLPRMSRVTLATLLRKVLSRIPSQSGVTYIIRRDAIEITTIDFAVAEKSLRVYPVADLVIPIPNSFSQQSVQGQATILGFGGSFGFAGTLASAGGGVVGLGGGVVGLGGVGGGLAGIGGLGGGLVGIGGGLGGGLGGLGGLGLGGGGLGGLGGLGGVGLGGLGGGGLGGLAGGGGLGALGAGGGGINLGVGGGNFGVGGGQLGQFGNLGGQFGLQGGDQSRILIQLIRQVIATPREWAALSPFDLVGRPQFPNQNRGDDDDPNSNPEGNNLGFYPPSMALVVKATSTMHVRSTGRPTKPLEKQVLGPVDNNRRGDLVIAPKKDKDGLENNRVRPKEEAKDEVRLAKDDKKTNPQQVVDARPDPKMAWRDKLADCANQPWKVIAVADFLVQNGQFEYAVEFLKEDLKQGILVEPFVYQALALALRETKASQQEIERAELSAAEMQPLDADGYLKASHAMAELKRYDHALAFCQKASALEPNLHYAYADALDFAEAARDSQGMTWAAQHLLLRDWPANNEELHAKAKAKLDTLAKSFTTDQRQAEADHLKEIAGKAKARDLVIKANWGGHADVDLSIKEPSNSLCSCVNRQSVGGGTLIGDNLIDTNNETYVASQAFSGAYEISVNRVWGDVVGDKVQIQIVFHQGTPEERSKVETINLKEKKPLTIYLDGGRRTSLAKVPAAATQVSSRPVLKMATTADIFKKLRNIAESTGSTDNGEIDGGVNAPGSRSEETASVSGGEASGGAGGFFAGQNRVNSFVSNGADLAAQAVISADRRFVRLSLSPVFNTVSGSVSAPVVSNPLLPGGMVPPR